MLFATFGTEMLRTSLHRFSAQSAEMVLASPAEDVIVITHLLWGEKKNLLDNFLIDIHQIRSCIITPLHSLGDMWDMDDHVDLPIVQLASDRPPASRSYASPIVRSPLAETIHMLLLDIKELLALTQNK